MGWVYRNLIRPMLFKQDSERIHDLTLARLNWASRHPLVCTAAKGYFCPPPLPVKLLGLDFPNPVGLAAGMDKQAAAVPIWESLGFGFSELGGVTWHAQPGNPSPRMFRAIPQEALINRMGFNNPGAMALAERLEQWRALGRWPAHPVGINLGKSKITPLNEAASDYANSFRALRGLADFFVVNVSSPNTPNLRDLQDKSALDDIFAALQEINLASASQPAKPILVKVAPDLTFSALDQILELTTPRKIAGLVATNTTISRPVKTGETAPAVYNETGGLSGRPLTAKSTEIIRHLFRQTRGQLPIIGVGGIFSASDAWDKITAGASLVQIYSGMVYEGPGLAGTIVNGLLARLHQSGSKSLLEVVGSQAGS